MGVDMNFPAWRYDCEEADALLYVVASLELTSGAGACKIHTVWSSTYAMLEIYMHALHGHCSWRPHYRPLASEPRT